MGPPSRRLATMRRMTLNRRQRKALLVQRGKRRLRTKRRRPFRLRSLKRSLHHHLRNLKGKRKRDNECQEKIYCKKPVKTVSFKSLTVSFIWSYITSPRSCQTIITNSGEVMFILFPPLRSPDICLYLHASDLEITKSLSICNLSNEHVTVLTKIDRDLSILHYLIFMVKIQCTCSKNMFQYISIDSIPPLQDPRYNRIMRYG